MTKKEEKKYCGECGREMLKHYTKDDEAYFKCQWCGVVA